MARPDKYTREQMAEALDKARGLRTIAARVLGCNYKTVLRYCEEYPELNDIVEAADVERFERAWLKLDTKIDAGEPWALSMALRFYIERERLRIADTANSRPDGWRMAAERLGVDPQVLKTAFQRTYRELLASRAPVLSAPVDDDGE